MPKCLKSAIEINELIFKYRFGSFRFHLLMVTYRFRRYLRDSVSDELIKKCLCLDANSPFLQCLVDLIFRPYIIRC